MSGIELIQWAVSRCKSANIPPNDAAIMRQIRNCMDIGAALRNERTNAPGGRTVGLPFPKELK